VVEKIEKIVKVLMNLRMKERGNRGGRLEGCAEQHEM
jgi:hypothetical protein